MRVLRRSPFLLRDQVVVQLDQVWQVVDDYLPVVVTGGAGVVVQPQHLQRGQFSQVANLPQVSHAVFAQVKFLQLVALGEVAERNDAVDAEGDDFKVGHLVDETEVLELVAPQVEVLDALEVVRFGLVEDQVQSQRLSFAHIIQIIKLLTKI